jgi:hypothetical protein
MGRIYMKLTRPQIAQHSARTEDCAVRIGHVKYSLLSNQRLFDNWGEPYAKSPNLAAGSHHRDGLGAYTTKVYRGYCKTRTLRCEMTRKLSVT